MAGKIDVGGREAAIITMNKEYCISLTDIARYRDKNEPFAIINNWMRKRSAIELNNHL